MLRFLQLHFGLENTIVVFSNTGKENPETLDFVRDCGHHWNIPIVWLEANISMKPGIGATFKEVSYESASRNGEPFEALIRKYGLPNRLNRMCTGNLKIKIIEKYMRSLGFKKWVTAVGIRADEPNRVRDKWYPLVEAGITKPIVNRFWATQPFSLSLPAFAGNCDLCHLKALSKRIQCVQRNPSIADWWLKMEALAGDQFDNEMSVAQIVSAASQKQQQILINFSEQDITCACAD